MRPTKQTKALPYRLSAAINPAARTRKSPAFCGGASQLSAPSAISGSGSAADRPAGRLGQASAAVAAGHPAVRHPAADRPAGHLVAVASSDPDFDFGSWSSPKMEAPGTDACGENARLSRFVPLKSARWNSSAASSWTHRNPWEDSRAARDGTLSFVVADRRAAADPGLDLAARRAALIRGTPAAALGSSDRIVAAPVSPFDLASPVTLGPARRVITPDSAAKSNPTQP